MTSAAVPAPDDDVVGPIVEAIRSATAIVPVAGIVLGSGLGGAIRVAKELAGADEGVEIAYADLPGFPPPSVPGHAGTLWLGALGGRPVAIFRGRVHFYEGHGMPMASITSRVAAGLGARTMLLTAAVGAVDPSLSAGSLMVIRDHLNLMGTNPLTGWRMPDGAPAFVPVKDVYDTSLAEAALEAARGAAGTAGRTAVPVAEGIYAAVSGPAYETPAETEAMSRAGATVVGMSTVPEAVAAHALGMRVLGLSFVTNTAGGDVSHDEVLDASTTAAGAIGSVLAELIDRL